MKTQTALGVSAAPEAVFTPGSPGSWTAPAQVQSLNGSVLSGALGMAVAQGTHTAAIIGGEYSLTAAALPRASGAGATPAISNWVTCPTGGDWPPVNQPAEPALTAYQSPNTGDAIALMVNQGVLIRGATQMAVVDLTKMLDSTTVPARGNVCTSGTLPSSAVSFIALP
ncbi:hypothetical protein [Arthrobacter sp. FW306-04-A]|uniref:hypothetical protein n=1 Tax=Arthrobacter sp. FW306-04-A TaxID=2879619 RepID=UPI0037C14BE7|nr:hypothetical protein LFT43_09010 [Arthrobacter sp. FW306-04-A]